MPIRAPVLHHLNLYHYWLSKCRGRGMAARADINPGEIPVLLPYLSLVDRIDGKFHYRLVGSAVAEQFGHDLTGSLATSHVSSIPETIAAAQALGERVFANPQPIFVTGQFQTKSGEPHNASALILPLLDRGTNVNMAIFTRVAAFSSGVWASRDWLKDAPLKLADAVDIHDAVDLERCCFEWYRSCLAISTAA
ncbi:MAG: PAS domain-containing protein [Rhodomicrobium sp.]